MKKVGNDISEEEVSKTALRKFTKTASLAKSRKEKDIVFGPQRVREA